MKELTTNNPYKAEKEVNDAKVRRLQDELKEMRLEKEQLLKKKKTKGARDLAPAELEQSPWLKPGTTMGQGTGEGRAAGVAGDGDGGVTAAGGGGAKVTRQGTTGKRKGGDPADGGRTGAPNGDFDGGET